MNIERTTIYLTRCPEERPPRSTALKLVNKVLLDAHGGSWLATSAWNIDFRSSDPAELLELTWQDDPNPIAIAWDAERGCYFTASILLHDVKKDSVADLRDAGWKTIPRTMALELMDRNRRTA